ncbi:hypothetical protein ZWY2020_056216, partial [Hordeum vulgare]
CLTFFCPCVAFGRIVQIVDRGAVLSVLCERDAVHAAGLGDGGMGCLYSCCYRSRLREQYGLKEKPCADCCVHWFCELCAMCQEYRELKNRGFDPSLATYLRWHVNMEKMGKSAATVAPQAYSSI